MSQKYLMWFYADAVYESAQFSRFTWELCHGDIGRLMLSAGTALGGAVDPGVGWFSRTWGR